MQFSPEMITMDQWQKAVLPELRKLSLGQAPAVLSKVTLLAYFFWDDDRIEKKFYTVECAYLCAFRTFGLMPATLVVNKETKTIKSFCKKYGVDLQVDESLTGGLPRMSLDCIKNLHKRFQTDYVLIIQSDGMPVNSGLEHFLGLYDYVGAPWPGHCHWKDWFPYPKFGVGNGGFCLRSKRICEQAAKAYNAFWRYLPYNWLVGDDVFYCKTMPFLSRYWKRNFRFPNIEHAMKFAIEHKVPDLKLQEPPVGFHSEFGFREYVNNFGVPFSEYICV